MLLIPLEFEDGVAGEIDACVCAINDAPDELLLQLLNHSHRRLLVCIVASEGLGLQKRAESDACLELHRALHLILQVGQSGQKGQTLMKRTRKARVLSVVFYKPLPRNNEHDGLQCLANTYSICKNDALLLQHVLKQLVDPHRLMSREVDEMFMQIVTFKKDLGFHILVPQCECTRLVFPFIHARDPADIRRRNNLTDQVLHC